MMLLITVLTVELTYTFSSYRSWRLTILKSLFWDVEFREMCMLIFPVQSIAYFHVVLVVRHTLKYLFLIVLNYRVIDAYIFLRYLVNKCTHIMHNLQQHMLRVLLFFTVKFYWSTTLSRKPFLFFDCVDYSLFKKESTQAMNLYLNTQNSISCTDLVN